MRRYTASLIAMIVVGSTLSVFAQDNATEAGQRGQKGRQAEMLKRFDANGDGVLSEAERTTARASRADKGEGKKGRPGGRAKKADGEGRGGPMSPEKRQEILTKYDADGDGTLSEAERTTARAAHQKTAE